MQNIKENKQACGWETSDDAPETEMCCCYVETEDGTYENPCEQELDECCC